MILQWFRFDQFTIDAHLSDIVLTCDLAYAFENFLNQYLYIHFYGRVDLVSDPNMFGGEPIHQIYSDYLDALAPGMQNNRHRFNKRDH